MITTFFVLGDKMGHGGEATRIAAAEYAAALDGLELSDPVGALYDFCRKREGVRMAKEAGRPPPWSEDVILQRGRFLNVYREDDRTTKAVHRFASTAKGVEQLVHALFFARWTNRAETLDALEFQD